MTKQAGITTIIIAADYYYKKFGNKYLKVTVSRGEIVDACWLNKKQYNDDIKNKKLIYLKWCSHIEVKYR